MNIIKKLKKQISALLIEKYGFEKESLEKISLELPKQNNQGDLATNAAMVLCKTLQKKPKELAEEFKEIFLENIQGVKKIEIAGPGFINLSFTDGFWQDALQEIVAAGAIYGKSDIGKGEKINIEFGSPNPTGPLHIGHTRSAIFGDILANILSFSNFSVTRENYINDAGSQIEVLAKSVFLRYKEQILDEKQEIEKGLYPGEYLIPIAQKLVQKYGDSFLQEAEQEYLPKIKEIALQEMIELVKEGFASLNIKHDVNFSEKSLHSENAIEAVLETLKKYTYTGILPAPKGVSKDWVEQEQLLFKASDFGDDVDRALQKNDGSPTYFAADCAYHHNKIKRGFNKMILILGADHGGYIKRMKALVKALSDGKAEIEIKLCSLVNLLDDGKAVKMSKRDGSFITAAEIVEKVGADVLRFIMMTRKNDMSLDFDFQKALESTKDNPIFYIQYAHSRICSVFREANIKIDNIEKIELKYLTHKKELALIKELSLFPSVIETIVATYETHRLAFYLIDLAGKFHSYWQEGRLDNKMRFISDDENITKARLQLLTGVKNVISTGLSLFSIEAIERM